LEATVKLNSNPSRLFFGRFLEIPRKFWNTPEISKFLEHPNFGKPGNKWNYPSMPLGRHIMANAFTKRPLSLRPPSISQYYLFQAAAGFF
jgi:hypothetical protein